jgi:predicted DNA-binding antitoxin AbrB/MazE fold protein
MAQTVRAVYERGQLRLLDDVQLAEGQQVNLKILSNRDLALEALGDLIIRPPLAAQPDEEEIDEEALMDEIAAAFEGLPPLSETIIAERREGP